MTILYGASVVTEVSLTPASRTGRLPVLQKRDFISIDAGIQPVQRAARGLIASSSP
ncbi:hypothetical protein G7A66_01470 [Altererythrobacter sp. SALINAS58]|uniref:hypothetical protein n=1 Tax=Alteripontixanthobacter muriae TaxID=2705546 RepID=UPI0015771920|nr:hypothetical protein [Alteripontixanthobacter muriae]NTZ41776.1 hypothetical protein [Alteripontixanthobacter muriae]